MTPDTPSIPSNEVGDALQSSVREALQNSVRQSIRQAAQFSIPFLVMNALATIVACYGLFANSTAVVIGAMVIALLLGPISGIALALVEGDAALLRRAVVAEVVGALLVFCVAFVLGGVHSEFPLTDELLARTKPTLLDLVIALAGGAAGAYAQVSPRVSVGLVGVAIATALVPPLSTAGICTARGEYALAGAAFLLFFTNLIAIELASALVLWLHGYHLVNPETLESPMDRRAQHRRNILSVLGLVGLTIFLGINFSQTVARQRFERDVRTKLIAALIAYPGSQLADLSLTRLRSRNIVRAVIHTPNSLTPNQVRILEAALPRPERGELELHAVSVLIKEAVRDGYLHQLSEERQQVFQSEGSTTAERGDMP